MDTLSVVLVFNDSSRILILFCAPIVNNPQQNKAVRRVFITSVDADSICDIIFSFFRSWSIGLGAL